MSETLRKIADLIEQHGLKPITASASSDGATLLLRYEEFARVTAGKCVRFNKTNGNWTTTFDGIELSAWTEVERGKISEVTMPELESVT